MAKIFRIITGHEEHKNYAKAFLEQSVIAVGWDIGDISNMKEDEIRKKVKEYTKIKNQDPKFAINTLLRIKNEIKKGDYVIAYQTNNTVAAIGEVIGDYYYDNKDDLGSQNGLHYPHKRKVKWIENLKSFDRVNLPEYIRKKLSSRWPLIEIEYDFYKFKEYLNKLLEKEHNSNNKGNKLSQILTAIQTKPFLILAGVSGTGKTQIARIIAGVVGLAKSERKVKSEDVEREVKVQSIADSKKFSWKPIYEEITKKLFEYKDKQEELKNILKRIFNDINTSPLKPLNDLLNNNELISPFDLFAVFNRGNQTLETRREILERIKKEFKLDSSLPEDFDGIPTVNALKAWFFDSGNPKDITKKNINNLWKLFVEAVEKRIASDTFKNCLLIDNVGVSKLTQGLFWINPIEYLPLDSNMIGDKAKNKKGYIKKIIDNIQYPIKNIFDKQNFSLEIYKEIMNLTKKEYPDKSFFEISADAWRSANSKEEKR